VSPPPASPRFEVSGFLGRVLDPRRYRFALRDARHAGFRWSATRFRVLAARGERALVEAEPATGRTHQLRVHLAAAGAPIVGDELYGGAPAPRLQLHAASIALAHGGARLEVEAPLPGDLESELLALGRAP
jgi:23S rRNA-/tRNA-specific pseudouridylate synthase